MFFKNYYRMKTIQQPLMLKTKTIYPNLYAVVQ